MKYRRLFILNEGKAMDVARLRANPNFNAEKISDKDFENTLKIDPTTTYSNGIPTQTGQFASVILLPKIAAGDKTILDKADELKKGLENYYKNPGKYPLGNFKTMSTDEMINVLSGDGIADTEEPSKLDIIYDKYYSRDFDRETFNKILELDPDTTEDQIGDAAKQLLLPRYRQGEKDFLNIPYDVSDACQAFYEMKNALETDKKSLQNYASVKDFIKSMEKGPESSLIRDLKKNDKIDDESNKAIKDDINIIGSTRQYDIIQPLSHEANRAISGGYQTNDGMNWCTGDTSSYYWRSYTSNGAKLVCFMNKTKSRGSDNRPVNYQIQIQNGRISEFLDGNDHQPAFSGNSPEQRFETFLLTYPDIYRAIKDSNLFKDLEVIKNIEKLNNTNYSKMSIINSIEDYLMIFGSKTTKYTLQELEINLDKIDDVAFAGFTNLRHVKFGNNVKSIGRQAFKNCVKLTKIEFPNSLETIGAEAFLNDINLKGAVELPDKLVSIGRQAFENTRCTLLIKSNRSSQIEFNSADYDWIASHVKIIKSK